MPLVSALLAAASLTACEPAVGPYQAAIEWRRSVPIGLPYRRGRLQDGVQLPAAGVNHVTYDPVAKLTPNRSWRRWGTDRLVRVTLCVADDYRVDNPDAPRVVIGDLSRPAGGRFGPSFGGLGHASHQNGLDVDVYYPRWDERETAPRTIDDVDLERSRELLERFVAAGATDVYVGPRTGLATGSDRRVVRVLRNHDDHMHVRIPVRAVTSTRVPHPVPTPADRISQPAP